jgi:hypothetical protein
MIGQYGLYALKGVHIHFSIFSVSLSGTAKVPSKLSDKNSVKHVSHIAGDFLRLVLRLVHLGAEIQRDTDFLGYEAFSPISMADFGSLSQVKVATNAKRPGFVGPSKESLPLKAA